MSYRRAKKRKESLHRGVTILVVVAFFVLIFLILPGRRWFGGALHTAGRPVWKAGQLVSEGVTVTSSIFSKSKRELVEEIILMRAREQDLIQERLRLEVLQDENIKLRDDFKRNESAGRELLLGHILVKPQVSPYGTVVLDVGSEHGVLLGNQVFSSPGVIMGEIVEVFRGTSKVRLYTASGSIQPVIIDNQNLYIEARGKGAGAMELHLPREVEIFEGDQLLYPSADNYIVGVVTARLFDVRDPFQTILAISPVNTNHLRWLYVDLGSQPVEIDSSLLAPSPIIEVVTQELSDESL